ncbi:DNA repair protein RAD51 homolog 2 isoform X2 [Bubalus kerabau]|uniref:DNA repair protein RAD51 homolog 2 isoform X1 n=1 Tax=Bubalus bubalis TaxID=89462 RepID=UPI000DBC9E09|nr:DNA repair protein RAD51 homolog 2 isoform X1 [Bubalus bubalis]XP_044780747.1 DNA repair protein RAD51 homolog 2 isoform X1 [Bubalus bubalis]XP_044780749.1 DNA repair protein RAD51 homolog 2 isoform X1 [Bubalus bubalis]XP_044780750.1 DNA repair protein RAD51 homolog 2 isoform X1 [Bubalus bubalis]XP_055394389.1 DNA repair protein RAD51 homolog 2 isoform X2 [Bubalus carabanensis]
MGSKKLRRVGLSQELCDRLNRHQILTCQDFLCLSPLELMKMTGLSYQGVHELLCLVSRACAPQMQTAYEIKTQRCAAHSSAFLSTTLSALDEALHGGVACGSLTEITGPPGCGKTQFCIMMSILATLPTNMGGLEGSVVYIDTESAFSAERLVEIAESRFPRYFDTEEKLLLTSSKVHLYRELSCDEVLQRIESLEEEIISKGVKLVIIDSVASVVRKEFDTQLQGNVRERNKFLAREAASLKYLAEEFSIPVILTNQITTHLSGALASQADLVSPADDLSLSEVPRRRPQENILFPHLKTNKQEYFSLSWLPGLSQAKRRSKTDTKEIALGLQCNRFKKMVKSCSWQRDSYQLVPRQLFLNVKPKGEWKQLMFLVFSLHSKADKESMEFFFLKFFTSE